MSLQLAMYVAKKEAECVCRSLPTTLHGVVIASHGQALHSASLWQHMVTGYLTAPRLNYEGLGGGLPPRHSVC